jgi:transposase
MRRNNASLSHEKRDKLLGLAERGRPKLALRSRVILRHFDGLSSQQIATELGISPQTVRKWRKRYLQAGIAGLGDRPRPGRPSRLPLSDLQHQIRQALQQRLPEGQRWSVRRIAKVLGLPKATVGRAWKSMRAADLNVRTRARAVTSPGNEKRAEEKSSESLASDEHDHAS